MASVAIADPLPSPQQLASRLYEAHSEWLLRYCLHQLRDHEDAEDALQIVFLYAFRALRRGVIPECERAWLTTIARNVCHAQRRTRTRHPEEPEAELDRIALARPDHEDAGFLDEVRAALATLPENQRRALLLREWHGVSSSEIANQLELSEPATHALLFRARRAFANAMSASRSVVGLNLPAALHQVRVWLKPLLEGATVKAAVATTAAAVAVGGVVLERQIDSDAAAPSVRPAPAAMLTSSPDSSRGASAALLTPEPRERAGARRAGLRTQRSRGSISTGAGGAPAGAGTDPFVWPPTPGEAPSQPRPKPSAGDAPSPPAPTPTPAPPPAVTVPPVEPPSLPLELPPILGEDPLPTIDPPPLELPPPLDEVVPPVDLPPMEPLPLPPLRP